MVVGIDVAKNRLEVAAGSATFTVSNDEQGLEQLIERLTPLKPELVCWRLGVDMRRRPGLRCGLRVSRSHASIRVTPIILLRPDGSRPNPTGSTRRGCGGVDPVWWSVFGRKGKEES